MEEEAPAEIGPMAVRDASYPPRPGSHQSGSIQWSERRQPVMSPETPSLETATQPTSPQPTAPSTQATFTARDGKGIQITEPAMKQLAALMQQQGEGRVLRVGVRSGGCSGMSYTMDFIAAAEIQADDERYTYEPSGAPSFEVVCDPKSLLYIYGMQLDFSTALIGGGFNFTNPNATQTCGCGSSFAV
jgi:iron-sulfur cluster assembly accessory protein